MALMDLCQQDVVTVTPDTDIQEAARIMREKHVGDLVVCPATGKKRPVGMITDRDIVSLVVAAGIEPQAINVEDVMNRRPVMGHAEEGLTRAIKKMQEAGVRRLPIVNDDGELCGIVTLDDVLRLLAQELSILAQVTERQIANEQSGRALKIRFA